MRKIDDYFRYALADLTNAAELANRFDADHEKGYWLTADDSRARRLSDSLESLRLCVETVGAAIFHHDNASFLPAEEVDS